MRHFIDIQDIPKQDLRAILIRAAELKANPVQNLLPACQLAMIFEKTSTRTRFSFEVGINQLGGNAIVTDNKSSQIGKGETIADTARVLSRYVDIAMLRTYSHNTVTEFAENATIPVINGLTDRSHPCQIMCDIMTIEEHIGNIEGKKLAWFGDVNNMTQSWVEAAEKFGFELAIAAPNHLSVEQAASNADVIMTDTFVSMGDENGDAKIAELLPYQVNQRVMDMANDDAIFLHCLPAYRGQEVSAEVIDGKQSVVFDEAENRLHIQKAIMLWCFEK